MDDKYTSDDLKIMQAWPLSKKIMVTQTRIVEWYEHYNGKVYISFSGGKDSTVLLDLARKIYPDIEAIFVDTGLEFPEIRKFVKTKDNVTHLTPEMRFDEVIKKYGFNYPSKEVAKIIFKARKGTPWALTALDGLNKDGTESEYRSRYKKWKYLLNSQFIISHECCEIMKEKPLKVYEKQIGIKPIVATMANESRRRKKAWLQTGCSAFEAKAPISKPLSFWTEQDILQYLKQFNIPYCSVYGEIVEVMTQYKRKPNKPTGKLETTGEKRTGCMFCPAGCHLETPNRFQRMKITHPKQYDYCIRPVEENGLGLGAFLDYVGVEY